MDRAAISDFIVSWFFGIDVFKILFWILWPGLLFVLLRRFFIDRKDKSRTTIENKALLFYFCIGFLIILIRIFARPFSLIEQTIYVLAPAYPFLFPVIMMRSFNYFGMRFATKKSVKERVFIFFRIIFVFFYLIVPASVIFLILGFYGLGYRDFTERSQSYYSELSLACNELLLSLPENRFLDDDNVQNDGAIVPGLLRQLYPTKIKVISNLENGESEVWLMIGVTRPGFAISWVRHDFKNGSGLLELSAIAESDKKVLYSKQINNLETH
jgi:hypothetical protein